MPKSMTIRSPGWCAMRGDRVERAVGADRRRLDDVELDAVDRPAAARRRARSTPKYLLAEHLQIVERARHDRADDDGGHVVAGEAFELEQLVQPHRIFVGGAARIGGDPPARADLPAFVHQREDDVGVAGIDREQHGARPQSRKTSPACMTWRDPSAKRSRSAPSASSPSNRPSIARAVAAARDERRAERMRARQPARAHRRRAPRRASAPASARRRRRDRARKASGVGRGDARPRAGWSPARSSSSRMAGEVDAEADTTASPRFSSRMPESFAPPSSRSFGHFIRSRAGRHMRREQLVQRDRGDQRQRRRAADRRAARAPACWRGDCRRSSPSRAPAARARRSGASARSHSPSAAPARGERARHRRWSSRSRRRCGMSITATAPPARPIRTATAPPPGSPRRARDREIAERRDEQRRDRDQRALGIAARPAHRPAPARRNTSS